MVLRRLASHVNIFNANTESFMRICIVWGESNHEFGFGGLALLPPSCDLDVILSSILTRVVVATLLESDASSAHLRVQKKYVRCEVWDGRGVWRRGVRGSGVRCEVGGSRSFYSNGSSHVIQLLDEFNRLSWPTVWTPFQRWTSKL